MNPSRTLPSRDQRWLILGVLAVTLLCAAWLLALPLDSKDRLILGVSLKRWLMVTCFAVPGLAVAGLFAAALRGPRLRDRLSAILYSDAFGWIVDFGSVFFILLLVWSIIDIPRYLDAFLNNLRPAIAWYALALTGLGLLHYRVRKVILPLASAHAYLWGVLVFAISLILWNAFRYPLPLGYAGLYSLMADLLGEHHFLPPVQVPFYGPGGIPYAYPPFGFYLMALFTRIPGLGDLEYLRFAPPLYLVGACLALAALARRQAGSRLAGLLAGAFLAASPRSFFAHGQAAGAVRAPALAFALLGLVFFERAVSERSRKPALLAGLCFGLALLTHPSYALFFGLSAACLGLVPAASRSIPFRWRLEQGLLTALVGLVLSAPWWIMIVSRYGWPVLGNILNSHDNLSLLTLFKEPLEVLRYVGSSYLQVGKFPLIAGAALLGLALFTARREFRLPVWLAVITLMNPSEDRYIFLVCSILAAAIIALLADQALKMTGSIQGQKQATRIFITLILVVTWILGWYGMRTQAPVLSPEIIQLGGWFRENTPKESIYLLIPGLPDEAEWFPYYLQRAPAVGSWGAEWIGSYNDQLGGLNLSIACSSASSIYCVQDISYKMGIWPQYLVTRQDQRSLNQSLTYSTAWVHRYANGLYRVWQRIN